MGGSPPAAPAPPDPIQTGRAQTSSNVNSAIAQQGGGLVNVASPFGTINYDRSSTFDIVDPTTHDTYTIPRYTQSVNFSPEGQELLQQTLGTQAVAGESAQRLLTNANYGDVPDNVGAITEGRAGDLLNRQVQYAQPLWDQQRSRLDAQLRNQGNLPGSESYTRQTRDLEDQLSRDQTSMINSTVGQARDWAVQDYLRPLSVAQGLYPLGTPVAPSMSQTPSAPMNMQPTNWVGIYNQDYQNRLGAYNAQMQSSASQNAGIAGMISPLARIFSAGMFG